MSALATNLLLVGSCLGYGAIALQALAADLQLGPGERRTWSFAIGLGLVGWLMFPLGLIGGLTPMAMIAVLAPGLAGLLLLRAKGDGGHLRPDGGLGWLALGGLVVALGLDLTEAFAPPFDADSLAYHFAIPKQFLAASGIEFIPRAVDGAIPLLVQMTYVPALGLGGEAGLTLWTFLSGWAIAPLTFFTARRNLSVDWSLAVTAAVMTVPALVYGGGSGQVEPRLALFATVGLLAAADALNRNSLRAAFLAGLMVGFYAATKYIGLLLVLATGLTLLAGRGWLRRGLVFSLAVLIAGFQWYAWNALNTGDPFFPVASPLLGYPAPALWDAQHQAFLKENFFGSEKAVPTSIWWMLAYPLVATLNGFPEFESGRTGFGPLPLLLLPLVIGAAWRYRQRVWRSNWLPVAAICLIFYALWFLSGSSQRIRHLLPILPLLLIFSSVAAVRFCEGLEIRRPLAAAFLVSISFQLAVQGIFSRPFVAYLLNDQSRSAFIDANVTHAGVVDAVNQALPADARVAVLSQRQLTYLLDRPAFWAHPAHQMVLLLRPGTSNPARFYSELRTKGFTHLLYSRDSTDDGLGPSEQLAEALVDAGCATEVLRQPVMGFGSRTLAALGADTGTFEGVLLGLTEDGCRLPSPAASANHKAPEPGDRP